jgi:hypothetical protein
MARGKNATALFDVIHAAKKPPRSSPVAAMPTPRWWAKDKKPLVPPGAPPAGETAGKQTSWLAAVKKSIAPVREESSHPPDVDSRAESRSKFEPVESGQPQLREAYEPENESDPMIESAPAVASDRSEPATVENMPVETRPAGIRWMARPDPVAKSDVAASETSDETPPLVAEVKTKFADRFRDRARAAEDSEESRGRRAEPPVAAIDRAAGEVSFRFSYLGVIGLAVIVLLAMTLAFILGTRISNGRADAKGTRSVPTVAGKQTASSGDGSLSAVAPVKPQPIRPDVIAVGHDRPPISPGVIRTPAAPVKPVPQPTMHAGIDNPRIPGRMYVVIQNYPDAESAKKVSTILNDAGIDCSVVRNLKTWVPDGWYSVVGYRPFKSSQETSDYGKTVAALRPNFPGHAANQMQLYLWRADAERD